MYVYVCSCACACARVYYSPGVKVYIGGLRPSGMNCLKLASGESETKPYK